MSKIAIIGYGNVGYHLTKRLSKRNDVSIFTRSPLEDHVQELSEFDPNGFDFIILAVPDGVVAEVSASIANSEAVVAHTSGSRPIEDLSKHRKYGVIYPLQTMSRAKEVDFNTFPIFIEGSDDEAEMKLFSFARSFGTDVRLITSANRARIHLAAVFACNFSNHMYHIAEKLLTPLEMTFQDIKPLVDETVHKAMELNPSNSQTGPAMRGDELTLNSHLDMLNDEELKAIYQLITKNIQNYQ